MNTTFRILSIAALMLLLPAGLKSQVKVNKPEGLDALLEARTAARKHPDAKVRGYHILIYNGDNRNRADAMKARFDAEYGTIYSEVVWDEPNFKVYVGLFVSKFECMKLFDQIKGKYQTAIIVADKIPYQPIQ